MQDLGRQFRKSLIEGTLNQAVDDKTKGVGSGRLTSSPLKSDCLVVTGSSNTDQIVQLCSAAPNSPCPDANEANEANDNNHLIWRLGKNN